MFAASCGAQNPSQLPTKPHVCEAARRRGAAPSPRLSSDLIAVRTIPHLTHRCCRKRQPISARLKKGGAPGVVSGAFLFMDGRGEPLTFEVHLPSESPKGDSSPVVTKVGYCSTPRESINVTRARSRKVARADVLMVRCSATICRAPATV